MLVVADCVVNKATAGRKVSIGFGIHRFNLEMSYILNAISMIVDSVSYIMKKV